MKIRATCRECGREFQLDQLIEGPVITGKCPWCEQLLAPQYTVLLPEVIGRAERGGTQLASALRMLTGSWARFRIDPESVLEPLREALGVAEEEDRGRLRAELQEVGGWAERAAGSDREWREVGSRVEGLERDLRKAGDAAEARDRLAAQEVQAASEELAASAEARGASGRSLRAEAARLSEVSSGPLGARRRLQAAVDRLTEARRNMDSAGPATERTEAALHRLREALREAEEALAELG